MNLPRCLVIALTLTTGLYMLTNVAYLSVMSVQQLLESPAVGAVSTYLPMNVINLKRGVNLSTYPLQSILL